jgi:hypothetical protein
MISTVRRSRLCCAFLTSATRALRALGSDRWGRLEVGRPEEERADLAAGRAEVLPDALFEGGLVGDFLATVSFGRCAGERPTRAPGSTDGE